MLDGLSQQYPSNGITMMIGHLRSVNIIVPCKTVQDSLLRVSPSQTQRRRRTTVVRRTYIVPSLMAHGWNSLFGAIKAALQLGLLSQQLILGGADWGLRKF